MRGPECNTDHHMIMCRLKVSVHRSRQRMAPMISRKLNTQKLRKMQTQEELSATFVANFQGFRFGLANGEFSRPDVVALVLFRQPAEIFAG